MEELRKKLLKNMIIVAGVFVLVFIILFLHQGCTNKKQSYSQLEKKLQVAAEKYFEKTDLLPTVEGATAVVSSDILIDSGYLKKFEEMTDAKNCSGQVTVQKSNNQYNYLTLLTCEGYKTQTIRDEIISKVVTSGEGVYEMNNEYIYRGEKVNNYVFFADRLWRIIKITDDGYLKLISEEEEEDEYLWDNRYNKSTDSYDGINNYEKSRLREQITKRYDSGKLIPSSSKKKVVAKNICVGKRDKNNLSINSNEECEEELYGQYIDLIGLTDIAKASIDPDCNNIRSKSCSNYNYFRNFFHGSWSLIGVKNSTSQIYYVTSTSASITVGDDDEPIYLVIYVNSNEKLKSGDGSKDSPYTF